MMIEAKLRELQDELWHLSSLMRQFKTPNYLPDKEKKLFSETSWRKDCIGISHVNSTPGRFSQKAQN